MTELLAAAVVAIVGLYFVGLGVVSLSAPAVASRFLLRHAHTAFAHYLELLIRLLVGSALLVRAPSMRYSDLFVAFGWILVITTTGLAVIPWRWHQRFAERFVPRAIRHLKLIAIVSLGLGCFILAATVLGSPANARAPVRYKLVNRTPARATTQASVYHSAVRIER